MGKVCSTPGRDEKCMCYSHNLKGRDHSEYIGLDGRIILKSYLKNVVFDGEDWIHVVLDVD
jgi:hypothetical protein